MDTKIFLNISVKDLDKSKEFFTKLGFTFNQEFTDDKAACLVISDSIYAMLLKEEFFKSFTKQGICDTSKENEVIFALSADSREKVDEMARLAVEAGGTIQRDPQDYGWMYGQSFCDLDGHIWEVFYMDESKRPAA